MRTRFVGGHLHGQIKDLPRESRYWETAIPGPVSINESFDRYRYEPCFRRATYERRACAFGMHAQLHVMALVGMPEAHFMRAIADIVEGVV